MIKSGEVYFAPHANFNDPFDCNPSFPASAILRQQDPVTGEWVKRHPKDLDPNNLAIDFQVTTRDFGRNTFFDDWSIVSLSLDPIHPLLWSHYASSHTGICIEYTLDTSLLPKKIGLRQVTYSDKRPPFGMRQTFGNNEQIRNAMIEVLSTKAEYWSYEQEVRLIKQISPAALSVDGMKISSLIIGCRTSPENTEKAKLWAKEIGVPLREAFMIENLYKLQIDEAGSLLLKSIPPPPSIFKFQSTDTK
jgi:hypothetical protein